MPAINYYEGHGIKMVASGETSSAYLFASFPVYFVPPSSHSVSEFMGNFATTFCILALRDKNNATLMCPIPLEVNSCTTNFRIFGNEVRYQMELGKERKSTAI